ncbi:MAG TPA: aminodeoxychorismate/anthranilate synthase component II, partial [Alphaproteobacteria bacterium]|nr:aminodeoxychorismate/anthranilate synthase component II [Alphaproteobacteria bacterium]
PESIASEHGHQLLANFLNIAGIATTPREAAE